MATFKNEPDLNLANDPIEALHTDLAVQGHSQCVRWSGKRKVISGFTRGRGVKLHPSRIKVTNRESL